MAVGSAGRRPRRVWLPVLSLLPVVVVGAARAAAQAPTDCAPGGPAVAFEGTVSSADAKTYRELPFELADGTTRVEITYDWQESGPAAGPTATVLDLGLWDADGVGTPDGFRGWSGSRGGRVTAGQQPVFVQPDEAARGYRPAPLEPGTWTVDLGIANVGPAGASWQVSVTCSAPVVGPAFGADPVDATHVADAGAGWYHGDFHMHGYHSHAQGPEWQDFVDTARAAGLDFFPVTEYVTGQHWDELGAVQRANPDVLVWPGREIITYYGHAIALGETRSVLDWRHGHGDVSLAAIQSATIADGALFQVAHPDFFPPPLGGFCPGCYFELDSAIDWAGVDTIEVVTGPILASTADIGLPGVPVFLQNPFVQPAIDRWESLLQRGFAITAVSGSDSKGVESEPERRGYGSSATAVYASQLSRAALAEAVEAGHAYVRARGALRSPEVELTGHAPGGLTAMMGDTLVADRAELSVTVRGGDGQVLTTLRDGEPWGEPVPITGDPFTHTWSAERVAGSGPLGTFWRVDVADAQSLTVITNPIFLTGVGEPPATATPRGSDAVLPRTGGGGPPGLALGMLAGGAALVALARRSERTFG